MKIHNCSSTYFVCPPAKFKFPVKFAMLASKSPAMRPGLFAWLAAAILFVPFVAENPPNPPPPPNKSFDAGFDPCGWSMSPKKFAFGAAKSLNI